MSNQEILTKAVEKAIGSGWENLEEWRLFNSELSNLEHDHVHPSQLIFNHDFAKALWGKGIHVMQTNKYFDTTYRTDEVNLPEWKYRIQQMVIADDPIKYLGENL